MLTGNGAACYTSEERMYVSAVIMLGGFVQAVIVGNVALLVSSQQAERPLDFSPAAYLLLTAAGPPCLCHTFASQRPKCVSESASLTGLNRARR